MKLAIKICLLIFVALFIASSASAQGGGLADSNWPMFQHDTRHTGRSPFVGITERPMILWTTEILSFHGTGYGSNMSLSSDGTIYASVLGELFAINPADGSIRWTFKGYYSSRSTAAIGTDGTIYWGSDNVFIGLSPDGKVIKNWGALDANLVFGSSPAIAEDGTIYINHDGLFSLSSDGQINWAYPSGWWNHSSPAIGMDGTIYDGNPQGFLTAYRPNGTIKWVCPARIDGYSPTIGDDGTIYFAEYGGILHTCDSNGQAKWSFTSAESQYSDVEIMNPPVLGSDGTIYFDINGNNRLYKPAGGIYAINPDGSLKWKFSVPWIDEIAPIFYGPLVIDKNNNIFACSNIGECYAFAEDGSLLWRMGGFGPYSFYTSPLLVGDGKMVLQVGTRVGTKFYFLAPSFFELFLPAIIKP